jgi:hypothetical protein
VVKTIPLTRGYETVVDDEDYPSLSAYKWSAHNDGTYGQFVYAYRGEYNPVTKRIRGVRMHRQITGTLDAGRQIEVDHINHDTLDNQRSNLRVVNRKQNQENRVDARPDSRTGIRGVRAVPRKGGLVYRAMLGHNYSTIHLGYFGCIEEAVAAVETARAQYYTSIPKREDQGEA